MILASSYALGGARWDEASVAALAELLGAAAAVVFALTNTFLTGVSPGLDGGERLV
jgi:hypothetical protein